MNDTLKRNAEYGNAFRTILKLRYEPVAVRMIRSDETVPEHGSKEQMSYCQAVAAARHGRTVVFTNDVSACNVGASALGMTATPEKVASGEFHYNIGAHDTQEATAKMIASRAELDFGTKGAIIAPLAEADFEPDVMIIEDIPERVYWFVPLSTAEQGGRAHFSTAPFQAACVDATAVPMTSGIVNISIGCFGCRKRTDIKKDEMLIGIPWELVPKMRVTLDRYKNGILTKAKRE